MNLHDESIESENELPVKRISLQGAVILATAVLLLGFIAGVLVCAKVVH